MVIELAKYACYWLNAFPASQGISNTLSPRTLVTGEMIDFNRHCKFEFGQYVQTHEQHSNSMSPRTVGAIALRPTGNRQGGYYFMSLVTGRIINRNHATIVPMPEGIEKRVYDLTNAQDRYPNLAFGNRDNRIVALEFDDDDESNDEEFIVDEEEQDIDLWYDEEYIDGELEEVDEEVDKEDENHGLGMEVIGEQEEGVGDPMEEMEENQGVGDIGVEDVENDDQVFDQPSVEGEPFDGPINAPAENPGVEQYHEGEINESPVLANEIDQQDEQNIEYFVDQAVADNMLVENQAEQALEPRTEPTAAPSGDRDPSERRYNLRTNRERSYAHRYVHDIYVTSATNETPQMGMKQGVRMFGDLGVSAVKKEVLQLHDRDVIRAIHKSQLTKEQIRQALGYLMFLKRKKNGKIKGRGCADGRKLRGHIAKEDTVSPTVSTEAVFITAIVDAMEKREVAVVDIPGAFMQVIMDKDVYMRITGLMVDLLIEIDKSYEQFVVYERGEKVIYVELLRALYGTLRAARLFWEKLTSVVKSWGFEINPYDSCVANKTINGHQCTLTWHVDDLKISHKDPAVVTQIIEDLKNTFATLGELSISRGKRHDYLGMWLDFSEPGTLMVDMQLYIQGLIEEAPKEFHGKALTPAANHLFMVTEESPKLKQDQADYLHSLTMQLMYLAQRARPDLRATLAFLSTRVAEPTEEDWRKLSRLMKYLQSTKDLLLRLNCDGSGIVKWWIDASYAIHPNMRGHTGAVMSMGQGAALSMSSKQKLVARSSTESELIGVHDGLQLIMWSKQFMEAQGYPIKDVILYQDNKSTILLEKNGRTSSSKRTKHINIRYFYIKDRVDKKDLRIEYCPTEEMIADFHTKPLQGSIFYTFRDVLMNIPRTSKYHSSRRSVLGQVDASKEKETKSATEEEKAQWTLVTRHSHRNKIEAKQTNEPRGGSFFLK